MHRWFGRTALVTGASVGIGHAITQDLLRHGVNVVGCARRVEAIEAIQDKVQQEPHGDVRPGKLMAVKCDLTKEDDILSMFAAIRNSPFKGVDICVNNAGVGTVGSLRNESTSAWRWMFDINVLALSICTRETFRSIQDRGVTDGHIIHISSILGHHVARTNGFYSCTKFAVRALSEGLRKELLHEKSGVKITQISPALVRTEIFQATGNQDAESKISAWSDYLEPSDVSNAVIFSLATPEHVQLEDIIIRPILIKESHRRATRPR